MLKIGAHLTIAKGYTAIGKTALKIGANTFQFFTRNPRGAKAKQLDRKDVEGLQEILEQNHFAPIIAHAPYTMNLASADIHTRKIGKEMLQDDLRRMEYLPGNLYNFHPGSHVGQGEEKGIAYIVEALNETLTKEQSTTVLLETMAGKGTEIGRNFEQLAKILNQVKLPEKIGVCLDTCHVNDAGYDIKNHLEEVLKEFDKIIGIEKLKAIHLADSKNEIGAHKDRHATIGNGTLGWDAFIQIINHPLLRELPFCLETPVDDEGHKEEIEKLRAHYKE